MGKWMNGYLEKLAANRKENLEAGGKDRIKLQHKFGKLTARERIERLADPGSFEEIGSVVREFRMGLENEAKPSPSDGVVMGLVNINGKPAMVYSLDFTVMSGSIGDQGVWKIAELVQMAGQRRIPRHRHVRLCRLQDQLQKWIRRTIRIGSPAEKLLSLFRCYPSDSLGFRALHRSHRTGTGIVRLFNI